MRLTIILMAVTVASFLRQARAWTNPFLSQTPASAGLGKKSTALDVLKELNRSENLAPYVNSDSTAVVTGGNSGIGAVTVSTLAVTGMKVVLCARDETSAQEALAQVPEWCRANVSIQKVDLADMQSIEQASKEILERCDNIQVLVNNAGVMAPPNRLETKQGIELQFGTNHVGHFMLTRLLLPGMEENSRIVTVASTAHQFGKGDRDWDSSTYTAWGAYGTSKLANILFAKSLQDKLNEAGRDDVSSVSLHPGVIGTNLWRYSSFLKPFTGLFADKSVEQGAATNVYCALASNVEGGAYYVDCKVGNPSETAQDATLRKDLWEYTEDVISAQGFQLPTTLVKAPMNALETSLAPETV